jgi:hypothetical protein
VRLQGVQLRCGVRRELSACVVSRVSNEAGESDIGARGCVHGFIEPLLGDIKKSVK